MNSRDGDADRWLDQEAGPVVRPYAVTKGRTLPAGGVRFDLIDIVVRAGERTSSDFRPGPEQRRMLSLCRRPIPVVDLTSELDLPLGVVRVLLGDLAEAGMVRIIPARQQREPDQRLLRKMLDGLESL
jgi:Protein of unknown function (DUF742)